MTDFATRRRMMVDTQVRPSDVTKFPIIDAMLRIPREAFVPDAEKEAAYAGRNVRLAENRVVLEPRTLAKMLDAVNIDNDDLVLDIGAGFGYSSAIIARTSSSVTPSSRSPAATISLSRCCAPAISSGMRAASGRFFQYLRGISESIAPTFSRAGLKIDA